MSKSYNIVSCFILVILLLCSSSLMGQDSTITIYGRITTEVPTSYSNIMVVNLRKGYGFAAKSDGSFEVNVYKKDAIKIFCEGFKTETVSLKDSLFRPVYFVNVHLKLISYTLDKAVTIRPEKDLLEIEKEKSKIDQNRYDALVSPGLAGIMNPVSMLYQMFSKEEKDKKIYAQLLNQQEYNNAMQNIVRYFIKSGLFNLKEDEIERFIGFCNLNSTYIRHASMYDIGNSLNYCYQKFYEIEKRRY